MVTGLVRRTQALVAVAAIAVFALPSAPAAADQGMAAAVHRYVALGDSFASGESVTPYDPATNKASNRCHRSDRSYPKQVANENPLEISLVGFRACSGATTANITQVAQYPSQPPQLVSFPADVDIVSISIGGNDIGFADFAQACVLRQGCGGTATVNSTLAKINGQLPGLLADTYASLRAAAGPDAEVFVLGYPQIVGAVRQGGGCSYLTGQERPIIRDVVAQLNGVISQGAAAAGFTYVDATSAQSPFVGHEVCTTGTYFTNISSAFPFHPNLKGQGAYRDLLTRALQLAGFLPG